MNCTPVRFPDACRAADFLAVFAGIAAFSKATDNRGMALKPASPPFNDMARQQVSPDGARSLAHAAPRATLAAWVKTAARLLRRRGTLTLIWRADGLGDVLEALMPAFGAVAVLPVHPKPGQGAIRVLVRATLSSRAPLSLLPGLILNDGNGRPTVEAEAVLRGGQALIW